MDDPTLVEVLRLGARVECNAEQLGRLSDAASRLTRWNDLPARAEAHGLAPLLYFHLSAADAPIPPEVRRQLFAASVDHRDANRARLRALARILDAFDEADISTIVLKGAALVHLLYPSPGLRPLGDLDLLVDARAASRAQGVLSGLGFFAPASPTDRRLMSHHHLPAAIGKVDGHVIQVEIHTDALSGDTPGSLKISNLAEPPQTFLIEGRTAAALGHGDMLYHLARHTAERASLLRLIWVADVVSYAARYVDAISWTDLRRRYPFVLNALSLLHLVTPLPESLLEHVPPARADGRGGVGRACKPLAEIFSRGRSWPDRWPRPLLTVGLVAAASLWRRS